MNPKLHNLLSFTIIFLSGDLNLLHQSPDYILEKFDKYIGDKVEIIKHDETEFFKEYKKIWKTDDYRINSIFLFLSKILKPDTEPINKGIDPFDEEDWDELEDFYHVPGLSNIGRAPFIFLKTFNDYIGDARNIKVEKQGGLHHILKRDLFDVYKRNFE